MASKKQAPPIPISEFKAKALRLIDQTAKKGTVYTISKNGQPIAQVIPLSKKSEHPLGGSLKSLIQIQGEIVEFDSSEMWDALK